MPADYPLNPSLPEDYREHFVRLCELAKRVYFDMAKEPEAYGLALYAKLLELDQFPGERI
ncbi:hypothetical protein [Eisenbergiella sp.]